MLGLLRKRVIYRSDFDRSTGCFDADRLAAEDLTGLGQRVPIPWRASRARIAWRSGRRTAEQAPRSADLAWLWCDLCVGQCAALACSSPCRRPRLDRTNTMEGRRRGRRTILASAFECRCARPAHVSHHGVAADGPQSTHRAARTWRGCGAGQRAARSFPRRRLRRDRTNTATSRRQGIRKVVGNTFESRGARPARVSHHREAVDGPRSMRRAARTWRVCDVGQRVARSPPRRRPSLDRTKTAIGRRQGRQGVLVSTFESRGACPVRILHHGVAADGPRSTHAQRGLGMVVVRANAWRAPPHAVRRGSTALRPRKVGSGSVERSGTYYRAPRRREASLLRCRTFVRHSSNGLQCAAGFRMAHARAPLRWLSLGGWRTTHACHARATCRASCDWSTYHEIVLNRRKASLFRRKTVVRRASCGFQCTAGIRVVRERAPLHWLSLGR